MPRAVQIQERCASPGDLTLLQSRVPKAGPVPLGPLRLLGPRESVSLQSLAAQDPAKQTCIPMRKQNLECSKAAPSALPKTLRMENIQNVPHVAHQRSYQLH